MDLGCERLSHLARLSIVFIVVITLLGIINCAEIGPPPGGEEDKSPPYIVSSIPANGATGVPLDNRIILYFSERIVEPTGKKAVFISPRLPEEPKIDWKKDRLEIEFADSFKTDQTYIISLSTEIADLRRNRLDSLSSIAFSTGASIDSGEISGVIYDESGPKAGLLVGLYDTLRFGQAESIDSIYADYIGQTNRSGAFRFSYLPEKPYKLIAFEDRNRDERFDPGVEPFAVPDRPVDVGGELPLDQLSMTLAFSDTAAPAITGAGYSSNRLVRLRLSTAIDLSSLIADPSRLKLTRYDDTSIVYSGRAVVEPEGERPKAFEIFAGNLAEGVYRVSIMYDSTTLPLVFDSLKVKPADDKKQPEMEFSPDPRPVFLDQLDMTASFSEPLDTTAMTDETFQLTDDKQNILFLEWRWLDPLHLKFVSPDISTGGLYVLNVTEFEIADMSGNVLGDSLKQYVVRTLNPDSLGTISGTIDIALPERQDNPVVLSFLKIENGQTFALPVTGPSFTISVPSGKYLAEGFIDSDGDGNADRGSAVPYRLSETTMSHPDTISVRARFETAGVTLQFK